MTDGFHGRRLVVVQAYAVVVEVSSERRETESCASTFEIYAGTLAAVRPTKSAVALFRCLLGHEKPFQGVITLSGSAPDGATRTNSAILVEIPARPRGQDFPVHPHSWRTTVDDALEVDPDVICIDLHEEPLGSELEPFLRHVRELVDIEGRTMLMAVEGPTALLYADSVVDLASSC